MKNSFIRILSFILFLSPAANAQKKDTIEITAANLNTRVLREGTHRYLVYFKMQKDGVRTETQFWTRTIKRTSYDGVQAIEVNQEWEDKDTVVHIVKSVCDAKTMQPLYHRTWWRWPVSKTSSATVINTTIVDAVQKLIEYNGVLLSDADTARARKRIWDAYRTARDYYYLNWHLDLETFPLLPYKEGTTFIIPFYDPGTGSPFQKVAYTVTGSAQLTGYNDQKIDCWLLKLEEKGNEEIFWISKKTKEVLKLEQTINGKIYRYKIKLGFSI